MIEKLKKQNAFIIVFEFAIISLIIIGISYAIYNFSNNFKLKTIELAIDTDIYGDTNIDSDDIKLLPILDNEVNTNNNNVLKINFKVRGNKNNLVNNIIYDIALVNLDIDCELLTKYLKWELLKNEEIISSGNFSKEFDTIIDDRIVLTNIQQDLKDFSNEPDNYEFRLWISDSCQNTDISKCQNEENQSNLLNKTISGRIEIELYTGNKSKLERTPTTNDNSNTCIQNLDTSKANKPKLDKSMIAVYYDETTQIWKKADKKNSNINYIWYDYNNKKWANAVIVKDYKKYKDSDLGTKIEDEDIVAFYVWIPRYSYQVWNLEKKEKLSKNYSKGIEINFETGKSDSGSITCDQEKCIGNNFEWLTHPAFTQKNIKGFWFLKYETTEPSNQPTSLPNANSLINYTPEQALSTSLKLLDYGIKDLSLDLISNQEWGAVNYLTYSKYGICKENKCIKELDSTTNNITGIFDLESKNNEMTKNNSTILGIALDEIGIDSSNLTENIIYRQNFTTIANKEENYSFRNILY